MAASHKNMHLLHHNIEDHQDYYIKHKNIDSLNFIKIDVDSFDYEALLGAERTMKDLQPIILIETNDALKLRDYEQDDIRKLMKYRGYTLEGRYDNDNELWYPS